jgi:recombination protein RecA
LGRIVELYGDAGVGKTSLLLQAFAQAQKKGYTTYLTEIESALQSERARKLGVDLEKLIVTEPQHWGEVFEDSGAFLDALPDASGAVMGLDSIAAAPSAEEFELGIGEKAKRDVRAKELSQFLRRITVPLSRKQVCWIAINQTRDSIGKMFGPSVTTPGGHAVKFHSSVRIHLMGGTKVKDDNGVQIGIEPIIALDKNKVGYPFRKFRARLLFDTGWDEEWTTVNLAKDLELIGARERSYDNAVDALKNGGIYKCAS